MTTSSTVTTDHLDAGVASFDYASFYAACGLSDQDKELQPAAGVGGSVLASKSKPCIKFFSTSGCPYGEGCHFLHFVPGGIAALGVQLPAHLLMKSPVTSSTGLNDPSLTVNGYKTRLCNRFNTPEGCRFAENCHFAHGEADLRRPNSFVTSKHMIQKPPPPSSSYFPFYQQTQQTPVPASYSAAVLMQSADAAYNTAVVSSNVYNFTTAPMNSAADGAAYTSYCAPASSCSFNYSIGTPNTAFNSATMNQPSSITYQGFPGADQSSASFHAEPTPPGVTVPSSSSSSSITTSSAPHEVAGVLAS
ncbi:hypothetical protein KP509_17G081400 [Ceratopteris richardii]|uniref:C3H1-type domain-containing protein n=1 Tax=Ceratopteris richardii TaxID=49495 RepID=A0A8T2T1A7_CERRI|nr:hypothetical protein KP509_17G081400 [Ceratopteris richardii]